MNILSWFTHPHFVLNLYEFLLLSTKDILENVGNQTIAVAIDFHSIFFSILWKSMATSNYLVTKNIQNILFCVQQKKETTGWEQYESE